MNFEMLENNKLYLQGKIDTAPELSHELYEEVFYIFNLRVPRLSGQDDIIPVLISDKLMQTEDIKKDKMIAIRGQFRSYNKQEDGKSRLVLSVFCREICKLNEESNPNFVELSGYICKQPIFRRTPFDREITDVLIAVNRAYIKSDYIPCIAWGKNARFIANLPISTRLEIIGRIQSREYSKKVTSEETPVVKVAYELSISKITIMESEKEAVEKIG